MTSDYKTISSATWGEERIPSSRPEMDIVNQERASEKLEDWKQPLKVGLPEGVLSTQTSRGYLVDLIYAIAENISLTDHLTEYQRWLDHQIDITEALDEKNTLEAKAEAVGNLVMEVTQLRRDKMSMLFALSPEVATNHEGKPMMWCAVKHAISDWGKSYEVYLAEPTEKSYSLAKRAFDQLGRTLSLALGFDWEDCGACFFDQIKVSHGTEQAAPEHS